jgi:putative flavoprotein involved in K+ transport
MGSPADDAAAARVDAAAMTETSASAQAALSRIPLRIPEPEPTERVETVVIGAGQAGLSMGHHLARRGRPFVILEASPRVGDVWRHRFDSLRLYSPARYDGLPGMRFPGDPWSFPSKDEVADYLEAYAERMDLPVRCGVRVEELLREEGRFVVRTGQGAIEADNVVVASGTWQKPITPSFAGALDPGIRQLHSADYRNPSQLQPGRVLVVGASHSGSDIAHEVALAGHETILAGAIHGEIPFDIHGRPARVLFRVLWFAANRVLTLRTPIGRKASAEVRGGGGPLIRVKLADLAEAGVEHTPSRVAGVADGRPRLDDGRVLDVENVVWATGFHKDMGWIRMPVAGEDGWPAQTRGAANEIPGLYFVGLPFLQAFASMLVGGVGRDADYVARRISRAARSA